MFLYSLIFFFENNLGQIIKVRIFWTRLVRRKHKSPDFLDKNLFAKTQKSGFFEVHVLSKPLYIKTVVTPSPEIVANLLFKTDPDPYFKLTLSLSVGSIPGFFRYCKKHIVRFGEWNVQAYERCGSAATYANSKIEAKCQNRIPRELNQNFDILRISKIRWISSKLLNWKNCSHKKVM